MDVVLKEKEKRKKIGLNAFDEFSHRNTLVDMLPAICNCRGPGLKTKK